MADAGLPLRPPLGTRSRCDPAAPVAHAAQKYVPLEVPPPPREPPVIEFAGIPTEVRIGQTYGFTLPDERDLEIHPNNVRLPTGSTSGTLYVIGRDAEGRFIVPFMTQGGMPDGCYVAFEPGVDRGAFIEIAGILWAESPDLDPAERLQPNNPYPLGTRFCVDESARVWKIVRG